MEEVVPQVTEVVASSGDASMHAEWPGVLRDVLRGAGPCGLFLFQLWDELVPRYVIASTHEHRRAMYNALEYLTEVGLARVSGTKWYDIPLFPRSKA